MTVTQELNGESDYADQGRGAPAVQVEVVEPPGLGPLPVVGSSQVPEGGPHLPRHGGHPAEGGEEEVLYGEAEGLAEAGIAVLELLPTQDGDNELRKVISDWRGVTSDKLPSGSRGREPPLCTFSSSLHKSVQCVSQAEIVRFFILSIVVRSKMPRLKLKIVH